MGLGEGGSLGVPSKASTCSGLEGILDQSHLDARTCGWEWERLA